MYSFFSDLKMPISWKQLIGDCRKLSNVKIVCRDGVSVETHKIVLGSVSLFLKRFLTEIPTGDDITFFLPDFDFETVQEFLGSVTLNEKPTDANLARALGHESFHPRGKVSTTPHHIMKFMIYHSRVQDCIFSWRT